VPAVDDFPTDVPLLFTPNDALGGDNEEGRFESKFRCHISDCGFDVGGESADLMGFLADVRTGVVSLFFGIWSSFQGAFLRLNLFSYWADSMLCQY
jgi:hypothetical protein